MVSVVCSAVTSAVTSAITIPVTIRGANAVTSAVAGPVNSAVRLYPHLIIKSNYALRMQHKRGPELAMQLLYLHQSEQRPSLCQCNGLNSSNKYARREQL